MVVFFTQNTVRRGCWIGLLRTMHFGSAASSRGYFAQGRRAQTGWLMNSVGQISLYVTLRCLNSTHSCCVLPVITFKSHKLGQNNQKDLKMHSLDRNKNKKLSGRYHRDAWDDSENMLLGTQAETKNVSKPPHAAVKQLIRDAFPATPSAAPLSSAHDCCRGRTRGGYTIINVAPLEVELMGGGVGGLPVVILLSGD